MAYFCYFSFGENLDFPDFLQKKFYNVNSDQSCYSAKTSTPDLHSVNLRIKYLKLKELLTYLIQLVNKIAYDCIWTVDLWCRKRPFYQLHHIHCLRTISLSP